MVQPPRPPTQWLFQYNDEISMGANIEWLTNVELRPAQTDTKCITLYSFVPLVKYYHITYVDDDNKPLKTTCQWCNVYVNVIKLLD